MNQYLLGIDNGSTMTKAAIYDLTGKELAVCSDGFEAITPAPGYYERDLDGIWQSNVNAIVQVLAKAGIQPGEVAAMAVTGHGNGAHLVDAAGNPVRNSIEGADMRAQPYVKQWIESGLHDRLHSKGMQAPWPALSVLVMAWMRDNEPESYTKTKYFFTVTDYIRFKLTGKANFEITGGTGTGMLNTRDGTIDRDMLAQAGVPEVADMLAPLVESTQRCGSVTAEAAALTGLREGTPVAAGCYDVDSAALATGSIAPDTVNIIAGTWCNNQMVSDQPLVSKEFFSTTRFSKPGYYLMLEGSPTSASNLEWFVTQLMGEERRQAKLSGQNPYALCDEAVRTTTPQDTEILFLPFLYGSNVHPLAHGSFIGLEGWHSRNHVIRAVFEGICFSHRYHIEKLLALSPNRPTVGRLAGGGAKSAEWTQMFADVLGIPMERTAVKELGTLGAALCAAVSVGCYRDVDQAVAAMVKISDVTLPNPQAAAVYDKKYARYLKAIQCLDLFWNG